MFSSINNLAFHTVSEYKYQLQMNSINKIINLENKKLPIICCYKQKPSQGLQEGSDLQKLANSYSASLIVSILCSFESKRRFSNLVTYCLWIDSYIRVNVTVEMDSIEFGTEKEDFTFYQIPRNFGKQKKKTMIADMSRRHCSYNVLGKS